MTKQHRDQPGRAPRDVRRKLLTICLWAVFASGLAIEAFAPRLKIENNAFIMPPAAMQQGAQIRPDVLVDHERRMQWAAGALTVGGAIALAIWYRRTLAGALVFWRSSDPQDR